MTLLPYNRETYMHVHTCIYVLCHAYMCMYFAGDIRIMSMFNKQTHSYR